MSNGFPPIPLYPANYDSDTTLFLVYNTSETQTVADVDPFSEDIPVRPRHTDQTEIWANNGFATIAGELFYYDAVDKNGDARVCRLKRCIRNLGGNETQFNQAGTWVRGFVIAEHHNQLVDCTLLVENFVGENFSINPATLDWRIRHLANSPIITDDACPEIEFDFNIISTSNSTGTIATYNVNLNGGGSFTLQFGDGSSTTVAGSGTHTYPPGATIDPVVTVTTDQCQTVQTPIISNNPNTPTVTPPPPPFFVPVPIPPQVPQVVIPNIMVPPPQMNLPPQMFPPQNQLPSIIMITPTNNASNISVSPIPSVIIIRPPINIPSHITGPDIHIPSHISSNLPPQIHICPPPPIPPIQIQPPQIPPIQILPGFINSNIPSVIRVEGLPTGSNLHMSLIHDLPQSLRVDPIPKIEFDTDSLKKILLDMNEHMTQAFKMNMQPVKVDWNEAPTLKTVMKVQKPKTRVGNFLLGTDEEVSHEETDFPTEFKLLPPEQDIRISVVPIPKLELDTSVLESISIPLKMPKEIPSMKVEFPADMPTIKVEFPKDIPAIKLEAPVNGIPLFYNGPAIKLEPVQINLQIQGLADEAADGIPCVRIVPCKMA